MRNRFRKTFTIVLLLAALIFTSVLPASALSTGTSGSKTKYVTLMFTGDLMCDGRFQKLLYDSDAGSYDFDGALRYVKPIFEQADYVVGNLEACVSWGYPLGKSKTRIDGKPYHNAPESFLKALKKAGVDGLVMANNHNLDTNKTGVRRTINAVDRNGFDHTGLYKSSSDKHYFIIKKNGVRIAVLAYAKYFNERDKKLSAKEQNTMLSRYSKSKAASEVKAARAAGADFVVAYIHMGNENTYDTTSAQTRTMQELADAGVDYIIGSHPHVLQRKGYVKRGSTKVPFVYSMGNFTGYLRRGKTRETAILKVKLKKTSTGKVAVVKSTYIPCYMMKNAEGETLTLIPSTHKCRSSKVQAKLEKHYTHIRKILNNKL